MKELTFILALFFFTAVSYSENYYVANQGDDSNQGSFDAPFKTIQKALNMAGAGDSVLIRGGFYPITREIRVLNSGEYNNWLIITAYQNEEVIIDGENFTNSTTKRHIHRSGLGLIDVSDVRYVKIQGITVRNSRTVGFMIKKPNTHNIILENCTADRTFGSGIGLWYADSVKVLHCEIMRANDRSLALEGYHVGRETPHEALTIAGAKYFEVAYNHLHLCYKEGIDCKEVSSHGVIHHNYIHDILRQGLYVDCWFGLLQDVELHSNVVHDCEWGLAFSAEGKDASMKNIRAHHNILYNNRASGILFGVWGHDELRSDIFIFNNTVYNNGSPGHWAGPTGGIDIRSENLQNVQIFNNISANNWGFEIAGFDKQADKSKKLKDKKIIIKNNLSADFKDINHHVGEFNQVYGLFGDDYLQGNPQFVAPDKGDFRLKRFSRSRNAAIPHPIFHTGDDLGAISGKYLQKNSFRPDFQ